MYVFKMLSMNYIHMLVILHVHNTAWNMIQCIGEQHYNNIIIIFFIAISCQHVNVSYE